ncbi:MAG: hypothetical protein GWN01_01800, partial [Nitrosopumilaceae archaeon]|nr:hypothetical protein [Nitrosopumilaceae archaeon]NIU86098.1 hypothetical protein [Nitrosopumilaceae archaeon]NIX60309.1 hypothetical protein [Nitrosopumilaceae archaeon]
YDGSDTANVFLTDFDCPSYYDVDADQYISPILDDGTLTESVSNKLATDEIWQTEPWKHWFENYL